MNPYYVIERNSEIERVGKVTERFSSGAIMVLWPDAEFEEMYEADDIERYLQYLPDKD